MNIMRPLTFNVCMMMLIVSSFSFGQKKTLYNQSFKVENEATIIFNLENISIAVEESVDGKVHFDYTIEFSNYTKKEIDNFVKQINVEAVQFENTITLKANSLSKVVNQSYEFDSKNALTLNSEYFKKNNDSDSIHKKSVDSIIKELNTSDYKAIFKYFKIIDDKGEKKDIKTNDVKMYKSVFVIKVPKYVRLNFNGKDAQITFRNSLRNEIAMTLKNGFFKGKQLSNNRNKFKIEDANFKTESLSGGSFDFINVRQGLIGSIDKVIINSEFSKIEIGEIRKEVLITDFNSEYWLYNWSKDFKIFDMYSQYSKLYYFYPETDYSLKVVGNNTVNYVGNMKIEMQPTKKGEKFVMMERKAKNPSNSAGTINLDIVDGIIYSYSDSFTPAKK